MGKRDMSAMNIENHIIECLKTLPKWALIEIAADLWHERGFSIEYDYEGVDFGAERKDPVPEIDLVKVETDNIDDDYLRSLADNAEDVSGLRNLVLLSNFDSNSYRDRCDNLGIKQITPQDLPEMFETQQMYWNFYYWVARSHNEPVEPVKTTVTNVKSTTKNKTTIKVGRSVANELDIGKVDTIWLESVDDSNDEDLRAKGKRSSIFSFSKNFVELPPHALHTLEVDDGEPVRVGCARKNAAKIVKVLTYPAQIDGDNFFEFIEDDLFKDTVVSLGYGRRDISNGRYGVFVADVEPSQNCYVDSSTRFEYLDYGSIQNIFPR